MSLPDNSPARGWRSNAIVGPQFRETWRLGIVRGCRAHCQARDGARPGPCGGQDAATFWLVKFASTDAVNCIGAWAANCVGVEV